MLAKNICFKFLNGPETWILMFILEALFSENKTLTTTNKVKMNEDKIIVLYGQCKNKQNSKSQIVPVSLVIKKIFIKKSKFRN